MLEGMAILSFIERNRKKKEERERDKSGDFFIFPESTKNFPPALCLGVSSSTKERPFRADKWNFFYIFDKRGLYK